MKSENYKWLQEELSPDMQSCSTVVIGNAPHRKSKKKRMKL
jgi:hypothetical protein